MPNCYNFTSDNHKKWGKSGPWLGRGRECLEWKGFGQHAGRQAEWTEEQIMLNHAARMQIQPELLMSYLSEIYGAVPEILSVLQETPCCPCVVVPVLTLVLWNPQPFVSRS